MAKVDYKKSGVNIDEGNRFVSLIKQMVEKTHSKSVIGGLGGFAGLFSLKDFASMDDPVLVSSTDGVGTKLKIAIMAKRYDTVGIDLVAMSVNDLIVTGAKPLFFLDYIATGQLKPEMLHDVVKGITDGCHQSGTALLGGETAEMPGMYQQGDFDLAGFAVGIVDRAKIIDINNVKVGDRLIGLASTGFHSNGYSLLRKVFFDELKYNINDDIKGFGKVADLLLEPTAIYVNVVQAIMVGDIEVHSMVHITGGGFYDNIPRALPKGLSVNIDKSTFPKVKSVQALQSVSDIDEKELYRVFNMGIGYILIVPENDVEKTLGIAAKCAIQAYNIGEVVTGNGDVHISGIDY